MREVKYVPSVTKEKTCKLDGFLLIAVPSYPQRLRYLQESGLDPKISEGSVDVAMKNLGAMAKIVDAVSEHVKETHLQYKDGSVKIQKWEDVLYNSDCDGIIQELALALLNGFTPSKN